jgi:AbrB family looped-hinge helix DNA binding protein
MQAPEGKYMSTVKVGPKGQIVIPKEVRDMFGIQSGDMLLLLADAERGIAIERYSVYEQFAKSIFEGPMGGKPDETAEAERRAFAQAIQEAGNEDGRDCSEKSE